MNRSAFGELSASTGPGFHWKSFVVVFGAVWPSSASGKDVSPPPILQWFEAKYETMVRRTPDVFLAGHGAVWIPPLGRAGREEDGGFSVEYDPYDRFDLGQPGHRTKYGTEAGIKEFAATLDRARPGKCHLPSLGVFLPGRDFRTVVFVATGVRWY